MKRSKGNAKEPEQSYAVDVTKEDVSTLAESCTITLRATVLLSFWTVDNRWECLTADSKVEPDLFRDVKARLGSFSQGRKHAKDCRRTP